MSHAAESAAGRKGKMELRKTLFQVGRRWLHRMVRWLAWIAHDEYEQRNECQPKLQGLHKATRTQCRGPKKAKHWTARHAAAKSRYRLDRSRRSRPRQTLGSRNAASTDR